MPVVTESDVAAAFRSMFDAHTPADPEPALAALVPGGLWHGRAPQEDCGTYGRIDVTASDPEYNSSSSYLHSFTVTLSFWSRAGASDAGELKRAASCVFNRSRIASDLTVQNAEKLVDVRMLAPQGGGIEEDGTKDGTPVVVAKMSFEVLVQATAI